MYGIEKSLYFFSCWLLSELLHIFSQKALEAIEKTFGTIVLQVIAGQIMLQLDHGGIRWSAIVTSHIFRNSCDNTPAAIQICLAVIVEIVNNRGVDINFEFQAKCWVSIGEAGTAFGAWTFSWS